MADSEILRVIAMVPEATAKQIRTGMSCPEGIASRRAIGQRVYDNIQKHATRGKKTGDLKEAAADYLLQWSSNSLAQFPRPRTYSILTYRWDHAMHRETLRPGTWTTPSRMKHVDLAIDAEDHGLTSESEDEDMPLDLPSALQNWTRKNQLAIISGFMVHFFQKDSKGYTALIRTEDDCPSTEPEVFSESEVENPVTPPRRHLTLGLL